MVAPTSQTTAASQVISAAQRPSPIHIHRRPKKKNKQQQQQRGEEEGGAASSYKSSVLPPLCLYVGNVDYETHQNEFRDELEQQFGAVNWCALKWNVPMNKNRGFGFVEFKQDSAAECAVRTGTIWLHDREAHITVANNSPRSLCPPKEEEERKVGVHDGKDYDRRRWLPPTRNAPAMPTASQAVQQQQQQQNKAATTSPRTPGGRLLYSHVISTPSPPRRSPPLLPSSSSKQRLATVLQGGEACFASYADFQQQQNNSRSRRNNKAKASPPPIIVGKQQQQSSRQSGGGEFLTPSIWYQSQLHQKPPTLPPPFSAAASSSHYQGQQQQPYIDVWLQQQEQVAAFNYPAQAYGMAAMPCYSGGVVSFSGDGGQFNTNDYLPSIAAAAQYANNYYLPQTPLHSPQLGQQQQQWFEKSAEQHLHTHMSHDDFAAGIVAMGTTTTAAH